MEYVLGEDLKRSIRKIWGRTQGISLNLKSEALAVEVPRFGKGSGAKEDPLQPAG